ncbi:MAG: hypothetical protein MZU97_10600 [Bacillus subtilis]|nr:hypothetical protein [Bacillus subtilis]
MNCARRADGTAGLYLPKTVADRPAPRPSLPRRRLPSAATSASAVTDVRPVDVGDAYRISCDIVVDDVHVTQAGIAIRYDGEKDDSY